jgi:hypothetical protein
MQTAPYADRPALTGQDARKTGRLESRARGKMGFPNEAEHDRYERRPEPQPSRSEDDRSGHDRPEPSRTRSNRKPVVQRQRGLTDLFT